MHLGILRKFGGFGEGRGFPGFGVTHVLVGHVPVGPLPKAQHLPHDDPVAPGVTGRGEGAERDGLGGRPADRDLPALAQGHRGGQGDLKTPQETPNSPGNPQTLLVASNVQGGR